MNRGIRGEMIFPDDRSKAKFIKILQEQTINQKINLLSYCILDNHYHLILQNSSGEMSNFIKRLNGAYGINYRKMYGGKGYVFQNRYHSTLIQENNYLRQAIIYILMNPVRAGLTESAYSYSWSSIGLYYMNKASFVNVGEAEGIFGDKEDMRKALADWNNRELEVNSTRAGKIIGDTGFIKRAYAQFDRRQEDSCLKRGYRKRDYIFAEPKDIIEKFERKYSIKIENIEGTRKEGKRLRAELLATLKDEAGLKYSDIKRYKPFQNLQYSTICMIYKRYKAKCDIVKHRP